MSTLKPSSTMGLTPALMLSLSILGCSSATMTYAASSNVTTSQVPAEVQTLRRVMLNPEVSTLTLKNMDQLFDTRVVGRSGPVWQIPYATHDIDFSYTLPNGESHKASEFAERTYTDALLIIKDGKIVHEHYANGMRDYQRHMAWSMTKSLTSLAVGQAYQDGLIKSLDDRIDKYLPELAKGGYAGVTVRQVLNMTSGVDYDERYDFENPGVAAKNHERALVKNEVRFADAAIDIPRKHKPGELFEYKTIDTAVLGWMLERITGQTVSSYFARHIWEPLGAEYNGFFIMDGPVGVGREFTGAGFNGTLRDFGRIGLMMLNDGYANGHQIVSKKWVEESTKPAGKEEGPPGSPGGYGYQWWTITGSDAYTAIGLAGQYIYVDKATGTVVVKLSHLPLDNETYEKTSIEIGTFLSAASAWKP